MQNKYGVMRGYTVSFFGHREIDHFFAAEEQLQKLIRNLLSSYEYCDFLVGRDGEFDQCVSSTIIRTKRTYRDDNSSLILVLPYMRAEYKNNVESFEDYYDEIEICEESSVAHFKGAIQKRNRAMVDRSDLVVVYVDHEKGGAFQTMRYAISQNKRIVNIYVQYFLYIIRFFTFSVNLLSFLQESRQRKFKAPRSCAQNIF